MRSLRARGALAIAAATLVALVVGCSPQTSVDIDLPSQVDAPLPDETVQQLQASVTSAMGAAGASGAIVGVWAPWSGTWVTGLGTQSFADQTPVETDMAFRAADITRAMTCDVLFEVAAEGTVDLGDSVSEYVSGFPNLTGVTLEQLCDGTSGIGSFAPQLQGLWYGNPDRVWNPSELASYGLGQGLAGDAGTTYRDSDTGYVLLGLALERATGQSLRSLVAERVAGPLGLDATGIPAAAAATPGGQRPSLEGHWSVPDTEGAWNCTDPATFTTLSASLGAGDSGAVTDIDDLGRYAQALATQALTGDSSRFESPLPIADQPTWLTAAGGALHAGSLVGQYGVVPGYMTAAYADPTTGLTVAVVLNNSGAGNGIASWLAWELAAIASRAPAASGQSIPEAGLPWTAQQFHDQIAGNAICAPPAQ